MFLEDGLGSLALLREHAEGANDEVSALLAGLGVEDGSDLAVGGDDIALLGVDEGVVSLLAGSRRLLLLALLPTVEEEHGRDFGLLLLQGGGGADVEERAVLALALRDGEDIELVVEAGVGLGGHF